MNTAFQYQSTGIFYLYTQDTDKQKEISNMQQFDSGTKAVDAVS